MLLVFDMCHAPSLKQVFNSVLGHATGCVAYMITQQGLQRSHDCFQYNLLSVNRSLSANHSKNCLPMIAKKPTHSSHAMMYNITKKISAMSVAFSYTACNFDGRQYLWVTMHTTPGPILITSEYDSRQKGEQNA